MTELERIARLLCQGRGEDPDSSVLHYTPAVGAHGFPVIQSSDLRPQWTLYEDYVRAVATELALTGSPERMQEMVRAVLANMEIAPPGEGEVAKAADRASDFATLSIADWRHRYGLLPR